MLNNVQIKIFCSYSYSDIERMVNDWLFVRGSEIDILDLKFQETDNHGYSICLLYKEHV